MRLKRFGLIGIFLILIFSGIIVFTPEVSAQTTCGDTKDIILRLSDATNAHGEVFGGAGSYPEEICYDTIFGEVGGGNRTCDGTNKVVGLSDTTNAHAESPGQSNYATEVCYEGLSCAERAGGCQAGESLVVSLSSSTNAHLSNSAGYGVDICCVIGEITPPLCGNDVINSGEVCDGTDLGGYSCTDFDEFPGGTLTCKSDCSGFNTTQCTGYSCNNDGVRDVGEACDGTYLDGYSCIDFDEFTGGTLGCDSNCDFNSSLCTIELCDLTDASWSTPSGGLDVVEGTNVELIVVGDNCGRETVSFEVWEDELGPNDRLIETRPDDHIPPINVAFDGTTATGNWTAEWFDDGYSLIDRNSDPEYYFKAITTTDSINSGTSSPEELHVTEYFIDPGRCATIVICGDYDTLMDCNLDGCNVVDFSVGNNINCGDSDKMCACSWIGTSSTCNATWVGTADGGVIGECTYSQNTGDNCNDGFLTFSWTANWTWEEGKGAADDPENLFGECIGGSRTIECPAQIPLPFFGAYNFIVALIIIALIYVLWSSGSGKNRKKK